MTKLSISQVQDFTSDLDKIAVALGVLRQNGRLGNGQLLSEQEKEDILVCQIKLFRSSAKFLAQAVVLNGDSMQAQLDKLQEASSKIDKTLDKITSAEKIMQFSKLVISVAAAVNAGEVFVIAAALDNLLAGISEINR